MQCPKCGTDVGEGKRFCKSCGTPLVVPQLSATPPVPTQVRAVGNQATPTCPKCGSSIPPGRPFCGRCGARLGVPQQPQAAPPAITPLTRPPTRPRKPINWRKVGFAFGIPALLAGAAFAVWQFWPRVLLPPEKIGTILDRATPGVFLLFNDGLPGRQTLVLSSGNEIWDMSTRESIYRGQFMGAFLSPDSRSVFDNSKANIPSALYDWRSNKRIEVENPPPQWVSVPGRPGFANTYLRVRFSNRGHLVAATRPNGSLHLIDTATGKIVHTLREGSSSVSYEANRQTCTVISLAFTGDDSVLASGESNGNISLWNTKTGDLLAALSDQDRQPCEGPAPQGEDWVFSVDFSPNGELLASQDAYGVVRVWKVSSHKIVYVLPVLVTGVGQIRFSPDGRFLVTSSRTSQNGRDYGTWLVLNAASGHLLGAFGLPGQVALAFLPNGSLLIAQMSEGRVRVEKWAMQSRFRVPFLSSTPPSVEKGDSTLLDAYEQNAVQNLNMFQGALGHYAAGDGHGALSKNIRDAIQALPIANIAGGDTNNLELKGYRFSYTPGPADDQGRITSYSLSAQPLLYQQTGMRSFRVDQTGQVHSTEEAREATPADSLYRSILAVTNIATDSNPPPAAPATPAAKTTSYKKMDFGFNGCAGNFGEVLKGVTEEDMIKRASEANANGFTFQPSLGYGALLIGEYQGCKSPTNMSWPLYLRE